MSHLKNDSEADNRKDKINRARLQASPIKAQTFDMTYSDGTPYESVNDETPVVSDYEDKVNRQLYFEEQ